MSDEVYCGWQVANQGYKACPSGRCIAIQGAGSEEQLLCQVPLVTKQKLTEGQPL